MIAEDVDGFLVYEKVVVMDKEGTYWWVEEIQLNSYKVPTAKCRNGCSFIFWPVESLRVVV